MWRLIGAIIFITCGSFLVLDQDLAQHEEVYQDLKSKSQEWQGVRIDSAFHYATLMLDWAKANNDQEKVGESLLLQGLAYGYLNEFEEEEKYYRKALRHTISVSDSLGGGKSYLNIGVSFFYRGNLDSAAVNYEEARKIFEQIESPKYLAISLNNLGQVYSRTGNLAAARSAYERALEIKIAQKDTVAIKNTYFNLASLSLNEKDYQSALEYSMQTLFYAEYLQDSTEIGGALINIGLSLNNLEQRTEALNYYQKADQYEAAIANDEELLLSLHALGAELYFNSGDYVKTNELLIRMKQQLRTDAFPETQLKYNELSYQLNQKKGNYAAALAHLEDYMQAKEKYVSESVQKNISELEKKYETQQQQRKITELQLDQKNAALALAASENQRNIFILGTVLLIVLAGSLYYRYYSKKKTGEILTEKNIQISSALEERETLLKEIHHRVKNNLQVISSLLNLQAGSLEDEAAKEAVKEGQYRVKSMALIHQKLYNTDDIRGVDSQDYFENLFRELFTAFGVDQEQISYEVKAQDFKLDIDTLIPLGLIVNELITNAIKYAFEASESGVISFEMRESNERLFVTLMDNGKGMDAKMMEASNSFGWKMIRSLSRKLKAEISIKNDQGTAVELTISRYKLAV
ncbi:MAG: tetratricopeptide repeat protein [Cyclobacteriaceae bacterium]